MEILSQTDKLCLWRETFDFLQKNDKNLQNWLLKQYKTQWIFNKAVETPQEMRKFLVFNISKSRTQQFIGK